MVKAFEDKDQKLLRNDAVGVYLGVCASLGKSYTVSSFSRFKAKDSTFAFLSGQATTSSRLASASEWILLFDVFPKIQCQ